MLNYVDNFLNRITMYRLVLYDLVFLVLVALGYCFFGVLPYTPLALLLSVVILIVVCAAVNKIFAYFLKVPTNVESVYITALILALIITPPQSGNYVSILLFMFWAAVWAMAAKYFIFLNIGNKHLFNPAAFAVALTALTINQSASWWVGTAVMQGYILLGGLLIIRKVRRWDMVIGFLAAALVAMVVLTIGRGNPLTTVWRALTASPLFFFASIMLTEPLTTPPSKDGRIAYGLLVGWLFAPQVHFASVYFTPETALLAGNLFSYLISPKGRHSLRLIGRTKIGEGQYDFTFAPEKKFNFKPGQYLEWTLGHKSPDNRGNRRYFTIASSPTEANTVLGVKFYEQPSSFKRNLYGLKRGDKIIAGQLAGDFVLPKDKNEKLVFMAGGIGITPFRSMLKYLIDRQEKRSVILFYSNRSAEEIVYQNILSEAERSLGIKTVYTLTNKEVLPDWTGYQGYINKEMISQEVPDYLERTFYISGSHTMVAAFRKTLLDLGVSRSKIITDFFPGLA